MKRRPVLVSDLFCGAGGSSLGAKKALDALGLDMLLTCVNHWPVAIETHTLNHPEARHYCMDLQNARPTELVPEGRLDLLLASPTCTYFSRARGGKPVHDQQRMDPWLIIVWLTQLRVDRIVIENVPEFTEWGPLHKQTGKPIKSRRGEYFRAWCETLRGLGFKIDWKVLNAADYGAATTRKRFFLIGRSDGKKLRWPEPTHSKDGQGMNLFGQTLEKWIGARSIIDETIEAKSIWARKKPLRPNTIRRIAVGIRKYGGMLAPVYLDMLREYCERLGKEYLDVVLPFLEIHDTGISWSRVQLVGANRMNNVPRPIDEPAPGMTTGGGLYLVEADAQPFIINRHGENGSDRTHSLEHPVPSPTTRGAGYVVDSEATPFTIGQQGGAVARPVDDPVATVAGGGAISLTEVKSYVLGQQSNSALRPIDEPMMTQSTAGRIRKVDTFITSYYGEGSGKSAKSVDAPLDTITTKDRHGIASTVVVNMKGQSNASDVEQPLPTQTAGSQHIGVANGSLVVLRNHCDAADLDDAVPTVTAGGMHIGVQQPTIEPFILSQNSSGAPHSVDAPLGALTTTSRGVGKVDTFLVEVNHGGSDAGRIQDLSQPLGVITQKNGRMMVTPEAFLFPVNQGSDRDRGHTSLSSPVPTLLTRDSLGVVSTDGFILQTDQTKGWGPHVQSLHTPIGTVVGKLNRAIVQPNAFVVPHHRERDGQQPRTHSLDQPLPTVTGSGCGDLVSTAIQYWDEGIPLERVRIINGQPYLLDITFRMLRPHELAGAMGFTDEETEYEFVGTQEQIVKQIGNAVEVNVAKALITAMMEDMAR